MSKNTCLESRSQQPSNASRPAARSLLLVSLLCWILVGPTLEAHIVPPEDLHRVAESYRRLTFVLGLNPVPWQLAENDALTIAEYSKALGLAAGTDAERNLSALFRKLEEDFPKSSLDPQTRKAAVAAAFEVATRLVARTIEHHVDAARSSLENHASASRHLAEARQIWAAFEPVIRATDPEAHRTLGECWLEMWSALGSPGVLGKGTVAPKRALFASESEELVTFLETNYGQEVGFARIGVLAPVPLKSPTVRLDVPPPTLLPPGSNLNKQLPRPRQVLNMATRGVDESETALIALGDMAFDSPFIFGEPARTLGVSCNTCHNKSITNPGFFIPGLSARPGGMDVSNSFFAPHANNGHFDPLDTPDLRGIRFTAPYGRNGRFGSLREFVRNVITNEFNGREPEPLLLDGLIAYMLEFDFLPNPWLERNGSLRDTASEAAKRGEEIFNRPFEKMGGRSCASCHLPSDHFLDRRRHDIGSVAGAEEHSRDGALDTPTLLSAASTGPYFHDGSLDTLYAVNEWFNDRFELGLASSELDDLTAYVETVGYGVDAYEDTTFTLEAELEEFSFFLSAYELLKARGQADLVATTLETIAFEIDAHKWDVQDTAHLPTLDRLAEIARAARDAYLAGDIALADRHVEAYQRLYQANAEVLQ